MTDQIKRWDCEGDRAVEDPSGKWVRYADHVAAIRGACQWFWPEDDTSSDACADSPREALDLYIIPGQVAAYSCGGIVYTRYYGFLPPAEDADSDDNFEVDEPTEEAAEAKMKAEIDRRSSVAAAASEGEAHG